MIFVLVIPFLGFVALVYGLAIGEISAFQAAWFVGLFILGVLFLFGILGFGNDDSPNDDSPRNYTDDDNPPRRKPSPKPEPTPPGGHELSQVEKHQMLNDAISKVIERVERKQEQ